MTTRCFPDASPIVVHACGTVINPMVLAGQIHGGVKSAIPSPRS
jgi:hypothetical protein